MKNDAGPGHNQPPSDLLLRTAELIANANKWIAERPVIRNDDEGGLADDFLGQLRENKDDVDAAYAAEAEPYKLALDLVRMKYREPQELLEISISKLKAMTTDYLKGKKARLADEHRKRQEAARAVQAEAERLSREAAKPGATVEAARAAALAQKAAEKATAAAGKGPGSATVKGDYSRRAAFLTTRWKAEFTDYAEALQHFAYHPLVVDAVQVAANRLARELKDESAAPPGIKFIKEERA